jgi:hypothetical protein
MQPTCGESRGGDWQVLGVMVAVTSRGAQRGALIASISGEAMSGTIWLRSGGRSTWPASQ